jgi:regulator of RNase E activity RraA
MQQKNGASSPKTVWKNDHELFDIIRTELFSAVVGDIMDKMGLLHQFLPPQIRPLRQDMVITGRAMTVLEADTPEDAAKAEGASGPGSPGLAGKPFGLMLEALDDLRENEVYLCSGAAPSYALWGELMATRARHLGCAGAVVNGYSRDTKGLLNLNFPTFSYGAYAQDQAPRGRVIDFRNTLEIGRVRVAPGDIVIGDMDGVCIVPRGAEEEVFQRALEKARGEKLVQQKIREGMSAKTAFETYGIL